jgi:hypothetical protein
VNNATMSDKVFKAILWGLPEDPAGKDLCELVVQAIRQMGTGGQYPTPMSTNPLAGGAGWGTWTILAAPSPYRESSLANAARFDAQVPYQESSPAVSLSFKAAGSVRLTGYAGLLIEYEQTFVQLTFTTDPGPPYWLAAVSEDVVLNTAIAIANAVREQAGAPASTTVFEMVSGQWTPPHGDWPTHV